MKSVLYAGLIAIITLSFGAADPVSAAKAKTLYAFHGKNDGGTPEADLIIDGSGNLYGTAEAGGAHSGGTVFRINPDGTETALYAFCALQNCADGGEPYSNLIMDSSGNLYGTTSYGGSADKGTVFKLTPGGTETVIYSFQSNETDGSNPRGEIVMDTSGNIYGTTIYGAGQGSVFKVSPKGKETILHGFGGYPFDGGT
ncbi:MAG TPA: choice-of-anchor tandem repeat GloVer-containing protein, partial [Rhizomicrobium sp.]